MLTALKRLAAKNLEALSRNEYPGRGIIVGMDSTSEHMLEIYFVMGRSENSRNRILVDDGNGTIRTQAADTSKVEDPSLIIYTAMAQRKGLHVVSNGHQTLDYLERYNEVNGSYQVQQDWVYEPDEPNHTPRITAVTSYIRKRPLIEMSVIKRAQRGTGCERQIFRYDYPMAGFGHCITTYKGNGDPLPSFEGTPLLLPLASSHELLAHNFWNALNPEYRVALALKARNIETWKTEEPVIINALTLAAKA